MLPMNVICPRCGKPGFLTLRWVRSIYHGHGYARYWHLYIGHYDAKEYKKAMEHYKMGLLKSRPNGRRWCKVRYKPVKGEAQSDRDILMAKYNFNRHDLMDEERKKKKDFLLKTDPRVSLYLDV
jgi:hypothetical protein